MSLRETLRRQPVWLVLVEALALVAGIGWADYATGSEWSLFLFYALPIVLVVSKTNQRFGFAFAVLCAVTWWAAQLTSNLFQSNWGFALAVATRLFYFAVLVVATAALKSRRELDRARIHSLERAQELEREILRTSEREQQRIGRDLHDSLGPHLAAIGYAASFLADELRRRDQPEAEKADRIRLMVAEAVTLTRNLARGLLPVQMDSTGLSMALEDLARTTSQLTGIAVSFCETGDTRIEDPENGMHLYRLVQEAVNNAVKHGGAKNVTILLSKSERLLNLVVADDGQGMLPQSARAQGLGLHTMAYRARALGGQVEITSNSGEGTIVSCEIPLHTAPAAP